MNRTFKEVPSFTKKWHSVGLTDEDLRKVQEMILQDTKIGVAIKGGSGLRKLRIPLENIGKRSGGRVIYLDVEVKECVYLLDVYVKNEKTDLNETEKKMLSKLVNILKEE